MIAYFVRHPVAANLLLILMCVLGVSILANLERETFPEFAADSVSVSVAYPGASARDVDDEICAPIEDGLTGIGGMTELKCVSTEGLAVATAELEEGGEIITFFNEVFSAVSGINDFPDDAETPIVEIDGTEDLVALLAISGIIDEQGLLEYADELSDEILLLEGVADARVSGLTDRELQVEFDHDALRRYGVSSRDVVDAIAARSLRQPLGSAALSEGDLILRYSGAQRSVADMEDLIVIENENGALVRVSDLGRVIFVDSDENVESFINGAQAVIITVFKTKDADTIRVFDAVQAILDEERAKFPEPFELTVINNMSEVVEERLDLIFSNIAIGLLLVFATMWLFFSFKEALWISVALPASFLGGLFVMFLLGITINTITTVALLMAVGLIMDDGIVIAENIDKWRRKVGPLEAAAKGAAEVLPGVASSFITTACIFGPLMLLSGEIGQILRFIPMVLLITLSLSVVEGFLILPNHLSHVAAKDDTKREPVAVRALYWVRDAAVVPAAAALLNVRYFTLGASIAAFIVAIGLVASGAVKVIGFPATEGDTIVARVALTSGINRERTIETVAQLSAGLEQVNENLTPNTVGGQPLVERVLIQYATNTDAFDNGSHTATVTVDLLESALRNVDADDVLDAWRAATGPMADITQASFSQAEAGPGGLDIDVELLGRDLGQVEGAANALVSHLLRRTDVTEAYQNFTGGRTELQIELTPFGYTVGLTPQALAAQLRQAFEGSETDSFRSGASGFSVRVALSDSVSSLADLEDFPITLSSGEQTTLSRVAQLTLAETYPAIMRTNGKAVAQVQGKIDLTAITSTEISAVILEEIAPQIAQDFPDVELRIGGATQEQQESQSSILSLFLVGLIGVYLVLAFQFRSYSLPIVVMVAIPFALIGTITGHWLLGLDMSMPSIVGFASLAGIVVNNSILFLTFFKSHLEGDDYLSASVSAVRERFRPIVLSTFTTIAGLAPIIVDGSPQVQTLVPLVVAVAFGLFAAMILVLLVLPSLMSIYFDFFAVRKWLNSFVEKADVGGPSAV